MESYNQKAEENLLEMKKQKEETDKEMLRIEIVIGYISTIMFLILVFLASFVEMFSVIRILLIIGGSIVFAIGIINAIKIEQTAGYYECDKCHYKYIPTYKSVLFAMHYGRTRYIKCPKCNEKSWNKKVLTKQQITGGFNNMKLIGLSCIFQVKILVKQQNIINQNLNLI